VFGLSAAHVDAYAWVSARHVAIAGALATGALAARWSRHRWLAPLVYAVALASSEAALAVAPLWIALELATPRSRRARGLACIPVVALSLAYLVIYAALGGGTRASGGYHDPLADPLGFAALAAVRVPLLLGDAALGIPAELAHVIAEWRLGLAGLAAVGFVALAWWLTAPARRPASAAVNPSAATPASTAANPSTAADRPPLASTLAWLAAGGIAATVLGAAGFPSGRVLVIPDLAFAAVLGVILARGRQARWPGRVFAIALAVFHLVIAPIEALRAIARHEHRGRATEAIAQQIVELAPPHGRVLLVAASDPMVFLYPRGVLSDVAPGTARCWSTWSAARASHRITRTSAHTLAIEPIGHTLLEGSFDELFRAADQPFEIGATVEQCGATIRVAAVTGGRPARLEVTLRRSLDDPEIVMLVWRDHRLARFTPPRVGETVELPWSPGPSDLTARP
jgi:hypothetical protein